ncbi:MAG TPA: 2-pyrone-4,6-dicarboxylate hydrolase, partial [Delftia acidovorans]|nr:2-pyrone-4,6-dicarboxylate hydrolase [Delftia acidovorans]
LDMLEPLAERIAALGWHVQLHWLASQIEAHAALLQRLPCTLVFDHMARLADSADGAGVHQPAFGVVRGLVQQGRAWVKLSGPYLNSRAGLAAGYADCDALAQAWVAEAPQRLVWGSDWPHTTEAPGSVNDADLVDLLQAWAGTDEAMDRILEDNPARLYGFDGAA